METRVQKWGNSLALRIPKPFATEAGIEANSSVDVTLRGGKLIITPNAESEVSLSQLLARVNERNRHSEIDSGPAAGSEVW
ncbi:MAG TPA: AbrB/MazE/SpoVT family DNA-binding domain-containing protein [bacterium]|nr:AbrB/MazE/SpoVT family DNA-binding domain-containing protein [bacterium]